jgi:hypothetical protein
MDPVDSLDDVGLRRRRGHSIVNADAPEHEHAVLDFDISLGVGHERPAARLNPARLQRAAKGPQQSTSGGGDDVVERRGVRLDHFAADAIVLSDRAMRAESYWLALGRHVRESQRTRDSLDADTRDINGIIGHLHPSPATSFEDVSSLLGDNHGDARRCSVCPDLHFAALGKFSTTL